MNKYEKVLKRQIEDLSKKKGIKIKKIFILQEREVEIDPTTYKIRNCCSSEELYRFSANFKKELILKESTKRQEIQELISYAHNRIIAIIIIVMAEKDNRIGDGQIKNLYIR